MNWSEAIEWAIDRAGDAERDDVLAELLDLYEYVVQFLPDREEV